MRAIISRFAPAPTGYLHLGHVVNAIYVWGVTATLGGRVLLRIEDHDRQRSRPEYEAAILEDLTWLGFTADAPLVRQSERGTIYEEALASLRARGQVYACACSRAEIEAGLKSRPTGDSAPQFRSPTLQGRDDSNEIWYPGTCRDRGLAEGPGVGVRVRLEPSVERFVDLLHGPQEQRPSEQCGDLLVRDREGNWTYQFAAAVDDLVQQVTVVIRGDDLRASTGRQIQIARLLGRAAPPRFLHHPLVMKSRAQKLSKSDGDTGVRDLRNSGWTPESVIGAAAALAGLIPERRPVRAGDVSTIMGRLGSRP